MILPFSLVEAEPPAFQPQATYVLLEPALTPLALTTVKPSEPRAVNPVAPESVDSAPSW